MPESKKITNFSAAWNPKHERGSIRIYIAGKKKPAILDFSNAQNFLATLQILQCDDDPRITQDKWLFTGLEHPGH